MSPLSCAAPTGFERSRGHEPFSKAELAGGGKLQVAMLAGEPGKAARDTVIALANADDRLAIECRELYWLPSAGILDSELDLKLIEKTVGAMTIRTKMTVERLAKKL